METIGKEFAAAFLLAQRDMPNPAKDHTVTVKTQGGGSFSYKYAGLDGTMACVKTALNEHDITVAQPPVTTEDGRVGIKTELTYKNGEVWDRGTLLMKAPDDPQKVGSVLTYLRRYGLTSAVGIVAEDDDDGRGAQGGGTKPKKKPAAKKDLPKDKPKGRTPAEHLASIVAHVKLFTEAFDEERARTELINVTEFKNAEGEMVGAIDDIETLKERVGAAKDSKKKAVRLRIICHGIEAAYKKTLALD